MNHATPTVISDEAIREQYHYMDRVRTLLGDGERFCYLETFGCQQNEADSERLAGMAERMGYTVTDAPDRADLILVNTCAVREHAELKALSITGQFKHLKAKNPALVIGIGGCMVSQEHRRDDIKNRYPYVDFLFGTDMLWRMPEFLYRTLTDGSRGFYLGDGVGNIAEGLPVRRASTFKAWVSIMYGCNNFCTYCVVPQVRGRERSRRPDAILAEVAELAASGYREITLLGQNVNSYGKDLDGSYDFSDLLEDICRIEGDFLIRFMTSHPKDASHKLIDTIARNPKIARQFHLPLQAGSDRILSLMNRGYTAASYLELLDYMREKIPDIALSTDIIVGFPTETEEEFEQTLAMLRRVRYDSLFSFIYSPRKNTRAAAMEGQVPEAVKTERMGRLLDLQGAISREKNDENYEGSIIRVLAEGRSKTDPGRITGRNEKNRLVHFPAPDSVIGTYVRVRVTRVEAYALLGELAE